MKPKLRTSSFLIHNLIFHAHCWKFENCQIWGKRRPSLPGSEWIENDWWKIFWEWRSKWYKHSVNSTFLLQPPLFLYATIKPLHSNLYFFPSHSVFLSVFLSVRPSVRLPFSRSQSLSLIAMFKSILFSCTLFLFLVHTIAAPSIQDSRHLVHMTDFSSQAFSSTCGWNKIVHVAKCACYLETQGALLSDMVKQECRNVFGDDFASPKHGLCKSCEWFKDYIQLSDVNERMKMMYKAASDCFPSITKTSSRSFSIPGGAAKVFLRHTSARPIPLLLVGAAVVAAMLASSGDPK